MKDCKWIQEKLEKQSDGELPDRQQNEVRRHIAGCPACADYRQRLASENRLLREAHRASDEKVDLDGLARRLDAKLDALERETDHHLVDRLLEWGTWVLGFSILFLAMNLSGFEGGGVVEQVARDLCSPHRFPVLLVSLMSGVVVCAIFSWLISRTVFRLAIK